MELILVRHAIAEPHSSQMNDDDRQLTQEGRRRFEASLPGYKSLLPKEVIVWSSPLTRAWQTAEMLAGVLGTTVECKDVIAGASFESFFKVIMQVDPTACLAVVGHQPYLSDWCGQLCGFDLPFKKGAAASLMLEPDTAGQAELQWFMQPRPLRRLQNGKKE
ncbi:MAG: phosphohistidine phosphatase SixA [Ruminococcaceae bacterium]|nr:phosphohistidine phosphatase SixA [Oscillospiraceae bacterium]